MKIAELRETRKGKSRVVLLPAWVGKLSASRRGRAADLRAAVKAL